MSDSREVEATAIPADFCHLCGNVNDPALNIWYPASVELISLKAEYGLICVDCGERASQLAMPKLERVLASSPPR